MMRDARRLSLLGLRSRFSTLPRDEIAYEGAITTWQVTKVEKTISS